MLAYPRNLPGLDGVVETPVFSCSGKLLVQSGYYPEERLFVDLHRLGNVAVPERPSTSDVEAARALILEDLLGDFPFLDESDRAHAVAGFLHTFVRALVSGCTPLHVVEAPLPGSGKGLLCNLISGCATGKPCFSRAIPRSDDEIRKMVTAELSTGRPIILLDNVRERWRLDSSALSSVLTAEHWTDRILGETRMISMPNRALWLLTGNNPQLSLELARRCVRIRLAPRVDQPWMRKGFRHEAILQWAAENRARLVQALLTLVQAWIAEDRPRSGLRLGSFEGWSEVVGGILQVCGITGFLTNLEQFYEAADEEGQVWREFISVWWDEVSGSPQRVSDLHKLCEKHGLLGELRGDGSERSQQTKLGRALRRARDRVFGKLRLVQESDRKHRGRTYALRQLHEKPREPNGESGNLLTEVPAEVPECI